MSQLISPQDLLAKAWAVREYAFVVGPTKVGCSVLADSGNIYSGCNVEHRYRSHDVHAEINAITNMIAAGERKIMAVAIAAERERFTPCGACLDWVFQFADPEVCQVYSQSANGGTISRYKLGDLMPFYPR